MLGHPKIVVTQNNDSLRVFNINENKGEKLVAAFSGEAYAILELKNGSKRKIELAHGHTYLSQSSRSVMINSQIKKIGFFSNKGIRLRELSFL